ncbi:MAG: hybrid sensor histidine kinase/response regulator, partial [Anaerolinea sp.]|nr:hybrid sensor histidine kinase/response regulator [Anaerolinea sp.]
MSEQLMETVTTQECERGALLIVDDEEDILRALYRQFRREYAVYTARSAKEAYAVLLRTPVQVVISDQRMPDMCGTEFLSRVKTEFPDVIRLLLTGYSDIQAVIEAINEGNIYRYVTKPWDPTELTTIVREAFERYRLQAENRQLLIELRESNARLEQRVAERTAELEDALQRLQALNAQLQAVNAQKDLFLGMAAHDLRTPITVIQGFTDLLLHPRTPPEEFPEIVRVIRETLQNMLTMLNDILDITAIESGQLKLKPRRVKVAQYLEDILHLNGMIAVRKHIQLKDEIAPNLGEGYFDPDRIEQVFNNLLSNAFKFSHEGTTVTLRARRVNGNFMFSIIDQGQGIPSDELATVFGAFQKTSTRPTAGERSTGLGLSICKRIVELHG